MNVFLISGLLGALLVFGQTTHPPLSTGNSGTKFQIGHIYFYGYAGLDPSLVKEHLPIHAGEIVDPESFDGERSLIRKSVIAVTGRPPTDIAVVCCDEERHLLIYIGLGGASTRKPTLREAPAGNDQLDGNGLQLYQADIGALANAVANGSAGEDDSKGYALASDPAARRIELEMRAYAVSRGPELERVLANSANPEQREASAGLLGYAKRSRAQLRALISASTDPDAAVRNDAVRALGILLFKKDTIPANLDIRPLVELLWSGRWTDRNKASLALAAITRDRSPAMLQQLHEKAMPPLVEGARWDRGHNGFFLLILGRIAGIPPTQLVSEITAGKSELIIAAAEEKE